jgi:hypothetical protein
VFDEIDWASLDHAYGPATDTPMHLAALTSADPDARRAALDHLEVAVLHQGFPRAATAPAARVVAHLLARGAVIPDVRDELIEFLGGVAEGTALVEKAPYRSELLAPLHHAIHQSYPVVARFLDNADLSVRKTATEAAISHVKTQPLADQRPVLAARLRTWVSQPTGDRAYWVQRLGDLGDDTQPLLTDPDPHVRVCAALAPSLADNDMATDIIIAALSHAADHGIANPKLYGFRELITAAIARTDDFHRIATPAATIIRHEDWTATWGPLLLAAFRTPYSEQRTLSATQRDILTALVANRRIWNYSNGNSALVFRQAGLPFQREACARIAKQR